MPAPSLLRLRVRDPQGHEREVSFRQEIVKIGRSSDCDLTLESGFISRIHARILRTQSGWQITDEGSKNGVFVNGQRISGVVSMHTGDALRIGDFGVTVAEAEDALAGDSERTAIAPRPSLGGAQPGHPSEPEPEDEHTVKVVSAPPAQPAAPASDPVSEVAAGSGGHDTPVSTVDDRSVIAAAGVPKEGPSSSPADSEQDAESTAPAELPADLTDRERSLLVALAAAGPAGAEPAMLMESIWGRGGGDSEMLERLLVRAQQKLGARQIVRLPGGSLRLE